MSDQAITAVALYMLIAVGASTGYAVWGPDGDWWIVPAAFAAMPALLLLVAAVCIGLETAVHRMREKRR